MRWLILHFGIALRYLFYVTLFLVTLLNFGWEGGLPKGIEKGGEAYQVGLGWFVCGRDGMCLAVLEVWRRGKRVVVSAFLYRWFVCGCVRLFLLCELYQS